MGAIDVSLLKSIFVNLYLSNKRLLWIHSARPLDFHSGVIWYINIRVFCYCFNQPQSFSKFISFYFIYLFFDYLNNIPESKRVLYDTNGILCYKCKAEIKHFASLFKEKNLKKDPSGSLHTSKCLPTKVTPIQKEDQIRSELYLMRKKPSGLWQVLHQHFINI